MHYIKSSLVILILVYLVTGCKKDKTDNQNTNPTTTGKIVGKVVLTNEFGQVYTSSAGMIITAVNGAMTFSATTDSTGHFEIAGMSGGSYNLTYTKAGIGIFKRFGIPVDASTSATTTLSPTDTLAEVSTTFVSNLIVDTSLVNGTLSIQCSLIPPPDSTHLRGFRIFFAKDSLVSSTSYLYTPDVSWLSPVSTGIISNYPIQNLLTHGFLSGDVVYVVAYGESKYSNSYVNPVSFKKVFPNVNSGLPSNRVTIHI